MKKALIAGPCASWSHRWLESCWDSRPCQRSGAQTHLPRDVNSGADRVSARCCPKINEEDTHTTRHTEIYIYIKSLHDHTHTYILYTYILNIFQVLNARMSSLQVLMAGDPGLPCRRATACAWPGGRQHPGSWRRCRQWMRDSRPRKASLEFLKSFKKLLTAAEKPSNASFSLAEELTKGAVLACVARLRGLGLVTRPPERRDFAAHRGPYLYSLFADRGLSAFQQKLRLVPSIYRI